MVSSEDKSEFCMKLGAVGTIDRRQFSHWGVPPHWSDTDAYADSHTHCYTYERP